VQKLGSGPTTRVVGSNDHTALSPKRPEQVPAAGTGIGALEVGANVGRDGAAVGETGAIEGTFVGGVVHTPRLASELVVRPPSLHESVLRLQPHGD
jgi:hypothetical protein